MPSLQSRNQEAAFLVLLCAVLLVENAAADARFSFKIQQFSNPNGILQQGGKCDYFSPCDTYFEICVGEKCRFGKQITRPVKMNSVDGSKLAQNKFDFTVTSWPTNGPLKVQVTVWDDDANVDEMITSFPILVHSTPQSFVSAVNFQPGTVKDSAGRFLRYETGVRCNDNYHGPSCEMYCRDASCLPTTAAGSTAVFTTEATTAATEAADTTTTIEPDPSTQTLPADDPTTKLPEPVPANLSNVVVKASEASAQSGSDSGSATANISLIAALAAVIVVLVCVSVVAVIVYKGRNAKHRASRVPVIFDTDDNDSTRSTTTSYCDASGDDVGIGVNYTSQPKFGGSIVRSASASTGAYTVRMSSVAGADADADADADHDDAFQNATYYSNTSGKLVDGASRINEDSCGIYNRPPPPRPLHSDVDLLNSRQSAALNVYSTPSEMRGSEVYYNHEN